MSLEHQELIVREHERLACRLHAVLRIDSGGVVLSGAAGDGPDTIPVTVVDCSDGGAGLQSEVFLPRGCQAFLHVSAPGRTPSPGASHAETAWAFQAPVRLQRVTMLSREPLYYLGTAFTGLDAAQRVALAALLAALRESVESGERSGGGGGDGGNGESGGGGRA